MELTEEQIKFLDKVCRGDMGLNLTTYDMFKIENNGWTLNSDGEIDVANSLDFSDVDFTQYDLSELNLKFGNCHLNVDLSGKGLKEIPLIFKHINGFLFIEDNDLKDYFKNIKEEDFPYWNNLHWGITLEKYPFLINIAKKYSRKDDLKWYIINIPQTKLYYKD
jgi:hypothetical protein